MDDTCTYAREFVDKVYYKSLDKSRSAFEKLYHDSASLVWNGNSVNGREKILEFFKNLPISETNLSTLDAQPVSYVQKVEGKKMMFISCVGSIKFSNQNPKTFTQNFLLIAESEAEKIVWKIVSDTFRLL